MNNTPALVFVCSSSSLCGVIVNSAMFLVKVGGRERGERAWACSTVITAHIWQSAEHS